MKKNSVLRQIRRGIIIGLAISAPLSVIGYAKLVHPNNPTAPAKLFYQIIDDFVGSSWELRFQEEFNVDYEGILDDKIISNLYHDFKYFKHKNKKLLDNLKKNNNNSKLYLQKRTSLSLLELCWQSRYYWQHRIV